MKIHMKHRCDHTHDYIAVGQILNEGDAQDDEYDNYYSRGEISLSSNPVLDTDVRDAMQKICELLQTSRLFESYNMEHTMYCENYKHDLYRGCFV